MKFSVIIPLYNKADYIRASVESVLHQTLQDFEIIVVDDGSSDGGSNVVAGMADPRLSLVTQPNAGVSAARNRGIALAKGEWIAFLDADDWHHPEYLANLLFAQTMHPELDVVATEYLQLPAEDDIGSMRWPDADAPKSVEIIEDLPTRWMQGPSFFTCSVAVRSDVLRRMQPCFAPGDSHGEDLELWFRLAEARKIALVRAPFVAYRLAVEGSLSGQNSTLKVPPFLVRMRHRAMSGLMPESRKHSSLQFAAQVEITMARAALGLGQRLKAMQLLLDGRYGVSTLRWWLTAAMTIFVPSKMVSHWEHWRVRRTGMKIGAGETK